MRAWLHLNIRPMAEALKPAAGWNFRIPLRSPFWGLGELVAWFCWPKVQKIIDSYWLRSECVHPKQRDHHPFRGRFPKSWVCVAWHPGLMYYQHANDMWDKKTGIQATGEITTCLNAFHDLMIENETYRGPYKGSLGWHGWHGLFFWGGSSKWIEEVKKRQKVENRRGTWKDPESEIWGISWNILKPLPQSWRSH